MGSKNYFLSGTCKWAKIHEPDKKYQNYGIDLFLDEESKTMFKESGLQLTVKKDEKDGEYISLKRPTVKLIKGETVEFTPPMLLKNDNTEYEDKVLVGNGSHVTCKVLVYDTVKGKGHRLEAVRVDELVEYGGGSSNDPF